MTDVCRADDDDPRWDWQGFQLYGDDMPQNRDGYPVLWDEAPLWAPPRASITDPPRGLYTDEAQAPGLVPVTGVGIKDLIRELTGHRCIRCGHPYRVGQEQFWDEPAEEESTEELVALTLFEQEPTDEPRVKRDRPIHWSPCDEHCTHGGLMRVRVPGYDWEQVEFGGPLVSHEGYGDVQAAWRILTVHHLDENKRNMLWWNLVALCQRCHLNVQRRVKLERSWPFLHSEWFKPYAAGWYAAKYEGRVMITRAEAVARMDELLAYEHRQDTLT
jgi:hypothetical protein